LGEGGGRDGADDVGVAPGVASDQHAVTMTRPRPGTQLDIAVIPAALLDDPVVDSHPEWEQSPGAWVTWSPNRRWPVPACQMSPATCWRDQARPWR
jgi:hypothetical protein